AGRLHPWHLRAAGALVQDRLRPSTTQPMRYLRRQEPM
ncbi:YpfJ protein, zinc metalloprotease superfamily, partial [Pseudomonas sp. FEN]